jgi:hypothetical protein
LLTNEYSDTADERLYYKFFAEPKASMFHLSDDDLLPDMEEHAMEHHEPFAALIGLDWADQKHDLCLVDTASGSRELSVIAHTPDALNEWARSLRARFNGTKVALCLEQSRGSLIYALMKYDFLVLYPVNPQTLAKLRRSVHAEPGEERSDGCRVLSRTVGASSGAAESMGAGLGADTHAATTRRTSATTRWRPNADQQPADGTLERLLSASIAVVS